VVLLFPACKKGGKADIADEIFKNSAVTIQGSAGTDFKNVPVNPPIRFSFTAPINLGTADGLPGDKSRIVEIRIYSSVSLIRQRLTSLNFLE